MPLSTVGTGREDVTTTPWPVPQERRTLTVLFADIVGSTALTERLDPEDVRAVQSAYFDTVAGVLRRWQGTVEKYVGDAVMALFGARTSDGLDGYRAVRAALEIQAALERRELPGGVTLRVRVGVATGEAVVDLAAARDGGHGMASGAVLTTAARIQEYAPPGGVVVCAATHRATAGLVEQHALAPAALTGKARPVDVWQVTRTANPRPPRHHGPLVGRRRELATAVEQLTRVAREHRPRWVALVGPDGIGRSRLLAELRHRLPAVDGTPVRWAVGHCPPYPEQVFGPVAELLRDLLGRPADDAAGTVAARLAALVDGLVPAGQVPATVAALTALLDAPDRSAVAGAAAVRRVLLALAARRPVVVGVDDLDRAAPELGHFLHSLFAAATARGLPLAVLATHRPDRADHVPAPAGGHHRVELAPLGTLHSGRLLRLLLAHAGQPVTSAARMVPLVAGRPGYATAYVHASALPTGDPSVRPTEPPLPEPLRRRAAARLDRCDGPHRAVLMAAATLDGEFAASAVDVLLGWAAGRAAQALRRLTDAGLVRSGSHGGHVIVDPALRRCAYDRLPRMLRAEFARRTEATRSAGAVRRTGTARRAQSIRRAGVDRPAGTRHRTGTGWSVGADRPVGHPGPVPATVSSPHGREARWQAAAPHRAPLPAGTAASATGSRTGGPRPAVAGPATAGPGPVAVLSDGGGPRPGVVLPGGGGPRPGVVGCPEPGFMLIAAGPTGLPPAGLMPGTAIGRPRAGSTRDDRWAGVPGGSAARPVDPGLPGPGGVVVPLPSRGTGVPTGRRPTTGGRRRGEGVPRTAVPLPARAA
ncbi:adenylate/guanylate cyclase domain-containing protein [Micromonospora sp. NPDC049257]|uniref:AAA family ATPase n=1 Tax=Micromonospora sp. NPDC049257 TaxID=3155771 RepID=UPI003412361F